MQEIRRILIIGLGALGTTYAVKFQQYNPACIEIIVDENRKERYTQNGITYNGKRYDFRYRLPNESPYPADLILVCTKITGLRSAAEMIRKYVGEHTILMSLLNGVSSEEILAEYFPKEQILYTVFYGQSTNIKGIITHGNSDKLVFGEERNLPGRYSQRVLAVQRLFDRVGICYEIAENMHSAIWQKYVMNTGINQASALLRAPNGFFQQCQEGMDFVRCLMEETASVAKKLGIPDADKMADFCINRLYAIQPNDRTSMLQDLESGRQTEAEMLGGYLSELGQKLGVPTPYNEMAYRILSLINKRMIYERKNEGDLTRK